MSHDNVLPMPESDAIEQQAAEWIMRFEDGDATAADKAAYTAWYQSNERHQQAMKELSSLWGEMDILGELNAYAEEAAPLVLAEGDAKTGEVYRPLLKDRFSLPVGIAASVLVCMLGLYYAFVGSVMHQGDYRTAIGEQRSHTLPDGSTIILNTGTQLTVNFNRQQRQVQLEQGEAFFAVASDTGRPFSVQTPKGIVTVLGTEFSVRLRPQAVDIVVAEGKVVVAASQQQAPSPALVGQANAELVAGDSLAFDQAVQELVSVAPDELERKLSWRSGLLAFSGEPLAQVVEDISRYTDIGIQVRGQQLAGLPIAGYIKVGEVEAMLTALNVMSGIEYTRLDEQTVELYLPQ